MGHIHRSYHISHRRLLLMGHIHRSCDISYWRLPLMGHIHRSCQISHRRLPPMDHIHRSHRRLPFMGHIHRSCHISHRRLPLMDHIHRSHTLKQRSQLVDHTANQELNSESHRPHTHVCDYSDHIHFTSQITHLTKRWPLADHTLNQVVATCRSHT